MKGFELKHTNEGKEYLVYQSKEKLHFEHYVKTWLNTSQNKYFMQWKEYESYSGRSIYCDVSKGRSLQSFIQENNRCDLVLKIIRELCNAFILLDKSILDRNRMLLDPSLIFVFNSKEEDALVSVKIIYLPFKVEHKILETNNNRNNLFTLLLESYFKLDKKSSKMEQIRLLEAAKEGESFLLDVLPHTRKRISISKIKIWNPINNLPNFQSLRKINYPIFLLFVQFIILASIFLFEKLSGHLPLWVLTFQVAIIAILLVWQMILLLLPNSQYSIRKIVESSKEQKIEPQLDIVANANPIVTMRRASISVLNSKRLLSNQKFTWQIYQNEYLIGSIKNKVDLYLPSEKEELTLRICQRAGSFYCQALSNSDTVYLMDRMLYRYEDYLLPDECTLKVRNLHLRFKVQ